MSPTQSGFFPGRDKDPWLLAFFDPRLIQNRIKLSEFIKKPSPQGVPFRSLETALNAPKALRFIVWALGFLGAVQGKATMN
jgi:hypothetical protein